MTSLGMSTEAVTAPSHACSIQEADSLASFASWEHRAARFSEANSSPCGVKFALRASPYTPTIARHQVQQLFISSGNKRGAAHLAIAF